MSSGKSRDPERSRAAILDAAEQLFAERGFEGTSLGEIGATASVSRATPSYFFGSKEQLYARVLERVFAEREAATRQAFEPLLVWIRDGTGSLPAALAQAAEGYTTFLRDRPAFVRLVQREELSGGQRLRATPRESRAIADAFEALRAVARTRGLRSFRVDDAVLLFVSLTFSPLAQRSTFMVALRRDLDDAAIRRRHVAFVVDQLLHVLAPH
jgi:AcrR family transcriptional regulator